MATNGWLYHNPDTGTEWSASHPVRSGECYDAQDIRPATGTNLLLELKAAWKSLEEDPGQTRRRSEPALTAGDVLKRLAAEVKWAASQDDASPALRSEMMQRLLTDAEVALALDGPVR